MSASVGRNIRVPAGLVDAGLASAATFLIGLYAIRAFDDVTMGYYALFMAAFGLATAVSTNLAYLPAEKAVMTLGPDRRSLPALRTSTAGALAAIAGGAVMLVPAGVALARGAEVDVIMALAVSGALTAVVSPVQDHVRRMLHLGRRSWHAATTSGIQIAGVALAIAVLSWLGVSAAWIAFGSLGIANVASISWGLFVAGRAGAVDRLTPTEVRALAGELRMRRLVRSGRWLASTGIVSTGNNLVVSSIVLALAGEAALGYAEAARTIAQPTLVVAMGLRSVLGPDSMEAARARDRAAASSTARGFWIVLVAATAGYAFLAGPAWDWSPLVDIAPKAYVIGGLVTVTVVANLLNGGAFPWRLELIGADRESALFRSELWSNSAQLVVGTAMAAIGGAWLGAAARPLSMCALGAVRLSRYRNPLAQHYSAPATAVVGSGA